MCTYWGQIVSEAQRVQRTQLMDTLAGRVRLFLSDMPPPPPPPPPFYHEKENLKIK